MNSRIDSFRAPMVTAIGIILGFVLAFMGRWVTEPSADRTVVHISDWFIAVGFFIGIVLLLVALYRILNNRVPGNRERAYYFRTLQIFMLGIICSFGGTFMAIVQQILF
ncbi:ABC-type dipeptide/oligopeptide/nickel transport system permease subunit [Neisseria sp. HSC-16F19]|nr:hypothetical protein [Neisseria sp. HSC-16F19]MCP2040775.1 ABC-type dipeptide/oligopeptide/nickel transport system permease subunit [Neisseria sp. HSC-16F19]